MWGGKAGGPRTHVHASWVSKDGLCYTTDFNGGMYILEYKG